MEEANWTTIVVAVIGLVAPVLLYVQFKASQRRQAKTDQKVTELEKVKSDAEAIERAKRIYEGLIDSLRTEHAHLKQTIEGLNRELGEERNVSDALRKRVRQLEESVDILEDQLREARLQLNSIKAVNEDKEK